MTTEQPGASPTFSDQLGPPAQPLRYFCNKCGYVGEQGPGHDVSAGFPQQRCQYGAAAWGPFWSTEQVALAVAAERERCAMKLQVTRADVSLAVGELSAQEWRTCAAVLRWMQARIRA